MPAPFLSRLVPEFCRMSVLQREGSERRASWAPVRVVAVCRIIPGSGIVAATRVIAAPGIVAAIAGPVATLIDTGCSHWSADPAALLVRTFDREISTRGVTRPHPYRSPVFADIILATGDHLLG
jgi:hypothetical protein